MNTIFQTIGIVGYPINLKTLNTHKKLYHLLKKNGYEVLIDNKIVCDFALKNYVSADLSDIGKRADLAIVVGGDGNMLRIARILAYFDIKIIGINRGHLGFLTDLDPNSAVIELNKVLSGNFNVEKRFLLEAKINSNKSCNFISNAVNEIILHSSKISHMIEFDVYIDNIFAFSQRSNGIIISTPTGSTAYSLSVGGPILFPLVEVISLILMFPHSLSSRPLIINSYSNIMLKFAKLTKNLKISFDGQIILPIKNSEKIFISKSKYYLNLIHPSNYNYFNTLSKKLGWFKKLF